MRVIHIVHGRANPEGHNGISRVVYHLNKEEKAQGVNSEIWAVVDGTKTHYTHPRDAHVTVECFPRVRLPFGQHEIINQLIAQKDSIDLVHFHMIFFFDKNIIAKALNDAGIPFIITTHGTYTTRQAYTGKRAVVRLLYERKFLNRAQEIHVLGREEGTGLQKYGYDGPVFAVPNGMALHEIPDQLPAYNPTGGKLQGIWIGVLRDDKNLQAMIRAVAAVPEEIRSQFVISLVGPDYRGNANRYRALAASLGVADHFVFPGPLYGQDKFDAIAAADFYIMPSHTEGMSLALLDAFAYGKPSLITSGCGMNYYRDQDCFVTCEPYAHDIRQGIEDLFARRSDWADMGDRAHKLVQTRFNWPAVARAMVTQYERLTGDVT